MGTGLGGCHVPHDATFIPREVADQFVLGPAALQLELARMTDHYTADLYTAGLSDGQVIRAPVSRLVVDVERFADDAQEPMAAKGMGVIYTRTADGSSMRRPLQPQERQALLDAWYVPHHQRLTRAVDAALAVHGRALIVDGHSFPAQPLPYEFDQSADRPDVCIGTDDFHTPTPLATELQRALTGAGFTTRLNAPFAGALVPSAHWRKDARVGSIMLETRRSLYMNETTLARRADFDAVRRRLREALSCALRAL